MIEKYRNWLIIQGKAKSNATIINYISRVKDFLSNYKVEEINQDNINKYLLDKKTKHSISTYNGYLCALKSFFDFLKVEIELPNQTKPDNLICESISEEFFEKEIIPVVECDFQFRDRIKTVLYFMFYTGVRPSELANLKRKDIDLKNRIAKIKGKGSKERMVIFTEKVKNLIDRYFKIEAENDNAFNISKSGIGRVCSKINPYIRNIHIHSYLFRHSFATMFLEKTNDIAMLSKLLGHNDVRTTMRYLDFKIDKIKETYDKKIK